MNNNVHLLQGSTGQPPNVPMHQPQNVFRYGEQTIWSTQLHSAGSAIADSESRLFSTPIGQQGQGFLNALTIAETNMKQGSQIPAGQAYDVFAIACQIGIATSNEAAGTPAVLGAPISSEAQVDQLTNIIANGVLQWDFTQTQVDIAPIEVIGAGGGVFGSVSTDNAAQAVDTAATLGNMNNGAGGCFMYQAHSVALPATSTFAILLRYGSRASAIAQAADVFVKAILFGHYKSLIVVG